MREYFYRIDKSGCLYHDQTQLTDPKFLRFFFKQLRANDSGNYAAEYPYLSPCGPEMNYVRCDGITPYVFTHLEDDQLYYNHTELFVEFAPEELALDPDSFLYHPVDRGNWGRIGPRLLRELSKEIEEREGDFSLHWNGEEYPISHLEGTGPFAPERPAHAGLSDARNRQD